MLHRRVLLQTLLTTCLRTPSLPRRTLNAVECHRKNCRRYFGLAVFHRQAAAASDLVSIVHKGLLMNQQHASDEDAEHQKPTSLLDLDIPPHGVDGFNEGESSKNKVPAGFTSQELHDLQMDFDLLQDRLRDCMEYARLEGLWRCFEIWHQHHSQQRPLPFDLVLRAIQTMNQFMQERTKAERRIGLLSRWVREVASSGQGDSSDAKRHLTGGRYQKLITALAETRFFTLVDEVHAEMEHLNMQLDAVSCASIVRNLICDRRVKSALLFFKTMRERGSVDGSDAEVLSAFIHGFSMIGDGKNMQLFVQTKQRLGQAITPEDCRSIMRLHFAQNQVEEARAWSEKVDTEEIELTHDLCQHLVRMFGEVADIETAEHWFQKGRARFTRSTRLFAIMLKAYAEVGESDKAARLFQEMRAMGIHPDLRACHILMNMFIKMDDLSTAQSIFNEMQRIGHKPTVYGYSILMNGYAKRGDVDSARILLDVMRSQDIMPTHVSYTTLMDGLSRKRMVGSILHYFEEMKQLNMPLDHVTYGVILLACARTKNYQHAIELFKEVNMDQLERVDEASFSPDHLAAPSDRRSPVAVNDYIYAAMIYACGQEHDLAASVRLFEEMSEKGVDRTIFVYNALLAACVLNKDLPRAKDLVTQMREDGISPTVGTYTLLMEVASLEGRCDNVLKLFNILAKDDEVEEIPSHTVNTLLRALANNGHLDTLKDTFEVLRDQKQQSKVDLSPSCWAVYVNALLESDDVEGAKKVAYDMLRSETRLLPEVDDALAKMLTGFRKHGHWSALDELIDYADKKNLTSFQAPRD